MPSDFGVVDAGAAAVLYERDGAIVTLLAHLRGADVGAMEEAANVIERLMTENEQLRSPRPIPNG